MRLAVIIGAAPVLLSCGEDDARDYASTDAMSAVMEESQQSAKVAPPQSAVVIADSVPPSMIIRTGSASLEVDSLEAAVDAVQRLALRLAGFVASTVVQTGRETRREAEIVVRVPSPRFDEMMSGLSPLGKLESASVSAQDVGEEYVDINAQVRNRRILENRLLELLATRTGKLEEVLAVERELARVREEIDRQEGRLRYLRNQVAMSTLTVRIHEPAPLISSYRGENVIARAFRSAWRNFVGVVTGFIAALGVLIPLAVVAAGAWFVTRRMRKRSAGN